VALALKARFDPAAADGLKATYELRLGEDRFRVAVSGDAIDVTRGEADRPDATIESDPGAFYAVVFEGRSLSSALRSGDIRVEGDRAAVERLVGAGWRSTPSRSSASGCPPPPSPSASACPPESS
jgi:alkyl sulfatase BDS1-like metallo-beta-lactamase superfamily hydrolase